MTLPTITALPTPPSTSDDSATFNSRAFAIFDALHDTLVPQLNAYAAALPSTITGTDFSATSTSSVTIGTGAKAFTIQAGKQFQVGQTIRVAYTTTPSNFMDGQVTAYNSGTGALTVDVQSVGGAGTFAAWTVSIVPGGGGSFATLTGAETLSNKTLTAPTIVTITNGGTVTVPAGTYTLAGLTLAQTFTNKTIALGSNTVSGTIAQFNSACSDADFASLAGAETLTNKTLTAPTINGGTIASATLNANNSVGDTGAIAAASPGFRGMPASGQAQGAGITLALTDAGKSVANTLGGWTVPANASVAFPIGTVIELYNNSGASQTIAITADTLRWAGTANTGARTLAQYGSAILVKRTATEWTVGGNVS